jgi:hypothetical protein
MERSAKITYPLTPKLASVLANDDRCRNRVSFGLVDG